MPAGGVGAGHWQPAGRQPKRLLQQPQLSRRHRATAQEKNVHRVDGSGGPRASIQPEPETNQRRDSVCVGQPEHGEGSDQGLVLQ